MPEHCCDEEWHERCCGLHEPHPVPSVPLSGSLMPVCLEVSCCILPHAPCNNASSLCGLRNNGAKTMVLSLLLLSISQEVFTVTKANTLAHVPLSFLRPWYDRTRNSWPGASPQSGTFLTLEAWAKIPFIANNTSGVLWQPPNQHPCVATVVCLLVSSAWWHKSITLLIPKQKWEKCSNCSGTKMITKTNNSLWSPCPVPNNLRHMSIGRQLFACKQHL